MLDIDDGSTGLDGAPKPKVNLRTAGRWQGDLLAPQRVVKKSTSVPTIPSRWETTVHKGYREVLGFGSHASRWDAKDGSSGIPGPGQYGQPKGFTDAKLGDDKLGIRGTGGMASRSVRMGARSNPGAPVAGRGVPGPGKYDDMTALKAARDGKDYNQASVSSLFAKPTESAVAHPLPKPEPTPGPGQYKYIVKADPKESASACAAFNSKSQRLGKKPPQAEYPGPGEYFDGARTAIDVAEVSEAKDAVFKAPHIPRIVRVHKDLPTSDKQGRDVLGDFADKVSRVCLGPKGLAAKQGFGGPGAYEVNRDAMWEARSVGANGHGSFQAGPSRTVWVDEDTRLRPGAGTYDAKLVEKNRLVDCSAAFNSEAAQCGNYSHSDAPGPAYYSIKLPKEKKSFRLRNADTFVA